MAAYFISGEVRTDWSIVPPYRDMRLVLALVFVDKHGIRWEAEAGRWINGASVPRFFTRLFQAYIGSYRRASALHDVACDDKTRPSQQVHRMFYEVMLFDDTHPAIAWVLWTAVLWFGPRWKVKAT